MAENKIEIEVELTGQRETLKGIGDLKEGAEGVGETFKGVGELVGKTNQQIGESLGAVSDAVGQSVEAFSSMSESIRAVSTGGAGLTALLGPIGLVVTAVAAAVEAFRQFSGAAQEAENRQEAFAAAAGDLTSKLEALAEKGFVPAKKELIAYAKANLSAQVQKELLNNEIEKISKLLQEEQDAEKAATEAKKRATQAQSTYTFEVNRGVNATSVAVSAQNSYTKAQKATEKAFTDLGAKVERVNDMISTTADTYKGFEEQSKENLETKAKELIAQRATIQLLEAQVKLETEEAKLTAARNIDRQKTSDLLKLEGMNRVALAAFVKQQTEAIKALNEEALKDAELAKKIEELNQKKAESAKATTKAIDQQKLAEQRLREEQIKLVKESQLRQLQIKMTEQGYQQQIALAKERYNTGLALARDDALQRQIVEAQHQLEIATIEDRALQEHFRRIDARTKAEEKAVQDRLKAEQLAAAKQQQIQDAQMKAYQDFFASYGKGIAQAAAANILFGDSFEEAAASVLKSLAIEAASRALMETAMGIGAAALGSPSAAGHFQSAAIFAATAAAAKIGATALGGGGASTSGGSTASPTGSPQVASAPQREQAESRDMVFNINFGGAVVYDTKEAAKRAMLGDLIRTHNQNNRGMPRFQFAR